MIRTYSSILRPRWRSPIAFWLGAALLCGLIYVPGLSGPFLLDDYPNIVNNPRIHADIERLSTWLQPLGTQSVQPARPMAMLSFALSYAIAPDASPWSFKLTNLLLHLLTGLAVYYLGRELAAAILWRTGGDTDPRWVGAVAAAVWLLHPLWVSTVLYVVQRMAILAALFALWAGWLYLRARRRHLEGSLRGTPLATLGVLVLGGLGVASKANAALLPLLMLVVELSTLRFAVHSSLPRWVKPALVAAVTLPSAAVVAYLLWRYVGAEGRLPGRDFTLDERLLTQARVLWLYLGWLLVPDPARMRLAHDDIQLAQGWLEPATAAALAGWTLALPALVWTLWRGRWPVLTLGLGWFLAGHLIESTVIPLELVFEHRNYLPGVGPLWALAFGAVVWVPRLPGVRPVTALAVGAALLLGLSALLLERTSSWASAADMAVSQVEKGPQSPRSWALLAQVLLAHDRIPPALDAIREARRLDPDEPGYMLAELNARCVGQRSVPRERAREAARALAEEAPTAYSYNQLLYFLRHCASTGLLTDDAIERVLRGAARSPGDRVGARAYLALGRRHLSDGDTRRARAALERARRRSTRAVEARLLLASLYIDAGRLPRAAGVIDELESRALSASQHERLRELMARRAEAR